MNHLFKRVLRFDVFSFARYCMSGLPYLVLALLVFTQLPCSSLPKLNSKLKWETWSKKSFDKARKSDKLVLLFIDTNYNHECHLMRNHTFKHPRITRYIKKQFIPVRVNKDENVYLANKYKKYPPPTVVVFDGVGDELFKRTGFMPNEELIVDLKNIVNEPEPEINRDLDESGVLFSERPYLNSSLRDQLVYNYNDLYDPEFGGLDMYEKYIHPSTIEYALHRTKKGDAEDSAIVSTTLINATQLNDPVWGGFFHSSNAGSWDDLNYEKLSSDQGEYLSIYSKAYSYFKNIEYIDAAISIHKYLNTYLKNDKGVFFASQDADLIHGEDSSIYFDLDEESRKSLGMPEIDEAIYTNYNAIIGNGLLDLYKATSNEKYLDEALVVANWIFEHRLIRASFKEVVMWLVSDWKLFVDKVKLLMKNGFYQEVGFYHSSNKKHGSYLSDNLETSRMFLSLYEITKEKDWLLKAKQSLRFIDKNFKSEIAGYKTENIKEKLCVESFPVINTDENVKLVKLASKLFSLTEDVEHRAIAEHAMRYLVTPEIALKERTNPGILLAEVEYLKIANLF